MCIIYYAVLFEQNTNMDPRKNKLSHALLGSSSVRNKNKDSYPKREGINHGAAYFTGITNTHNHSVEKEKITKSCVIEGSEMNVLRGSHKSMVVDPDAFDIQPLSKLINSDEDKFKVEPEEFCTPREYRKRCQRIKLSPVKRIPSSQMPFKLDPRKIRQIYKECLEEMKARLPKYYGPSESAMNTYYEIKKCAFYKRRVSSNYDCHNVERARCLSNEFAVRDTHNTKMMPNNNIAHERGEGIGLNENIIKLDSASRNEQRATVSDVSSAGVEVSCQLRNTPSSSSDPDDLPELVADAVGSHSTVPFQAKKLVIKLQDNVQNVERKNELTIESSTALMEENDEEHSVVSSSNNSAIEELKTPKIKSIGISVVSSTNNSSLTQEKKMIGKNISSTLSRDQNSFKDVMLTSPRVPTRICSATSPRISRVVPAVTSKYKNGPVETISDSSPVDPNVLTESISEKLRRSRAYFKAESCRELRRTSSISYRDKWKRRKYENTTDLSSILGAGQESDITASTLDDDELNNDITNMNESLVARNDSEEDNTLKVSSCTNVGEEEEEEEGERIPSISGSTEGNECDSRSMRSGHMKRKLQRMVSTDPQINEHREGRAVVKGRLEKGRRGSSRNSINSSISVQEGSPAHSPRPIEAKQLSKRDVNDQNGGINPALKENSCENTSQSRTGRQSCDLDDLLQEQTKLKGMLDEFMCERPNSLEKEVDISKKLSKISSHSMPLSSPDSSTIETALEKHVKYFPAINASSKSVNTLLANTQTILVRDNSNIIGKDEYNGYEEGSYSLPINNKLREETIDEKPVAIIDENFKDKFTENPSEITLISKAHSTHDMSLNENQTEQIAALVDLQSQEHQIDEIKGTHHEKDNIVSNKISLPPKKRRIVNDDNNDNMRPECVESSSSSQVSASNQKKLGSKWDCVTSVTAKEQVVDANKCEVPINQNIAPIQVLQVLSPPFIPNQPQTSVQQQPPMQLQYQVQPQGLVVNVTTTTQQSHAIVVDSRIPPYPISILSYVQETNKPIPQMIPKNINSLLTSSLSLSTPSTSASSLSRSITTATSKSIHSSCVTSTLPATGLPCSTSLPLLSVSASSIGLLMQSPSNHSQLPLNNPKPLDHLPITTPISGKTTNDYSQINTIDQQLIKYTNDIIKNLVILRRYEDSWCHPLTQSCRQKFLTDYKILVARIIFCMKEVEKLQGYSSIYDVFTFIATHSEKVISGIPPLTFGEIDAVYQGHLKTQSETLNLQNRHLPSTSCSGCNPMWPPPYPNTNNSIVQNVARMTSPQPVPPPTLLVPPSTGMAGGKLQMLLSPTICPRPVPPPAIPTPKKPRAHSRSKPSFLSRSQHETLKNQLSIYRKIYRWLKAEWDKYHNMALYNESVRQLRQQELMAMHQQQQQKETLPQQYPLNPTILSDPRFQNTPQQPPVGNQTHRQGDDQTGKSPHPYSQSNSDQLQRPDRNRANINLSAMNFMQCTKQVSTIPQTTNKLQESPPQFSVKTTQNGSDIQSSITCKTMMPEDEPRRLQKSRVVSPIESPTAVTTKTTTTMSISSAINGKNVSIKLTPDVNENSSVMFNAEQSKNGFAVSGENLNQILNFSVCENEPNSMNGFEHTDINKNDEGSISIIGKSNKEHEMKLEPQFDQQQQQREGDTTDIKEDPIDMKKDTTDIKEDLIDMRGDTIDMKKELRLIPKMKVKNESCEIKNNSCSTNTFDNSNNSIFSHINDQSTTVELITLDDSLIDDDSDCISITSSHRGTVMPSTYTEINGISYNQSSIDEELECAALSKKLGIQGPSYDQNSPFIKNDIPVITSVMTIDRHTFEEFDKGGNNSLLMNEDIIDITDVAVKLERNIPSPHSDCTETGIDFVGEIIQGSGPRPNCSNCSTNKGQIVCECGEVTYCSNRCVETHWRELHASICKGPPINIDSIAEITLDDD